MKDLYLIRGYYFETSFEGVLLGSKKHLKGRFLDNWGDPDAQAVLKERDLKIMLTYEGNPNIYKLNFKLNKKKNKGKGEYIFPEGEKSKAFCLLFKIPLDFQSFIDMKQFYPELASGGLEQLFEGIYNLEDEGDEEISEN